MASVIGIFFGSDTGNTENIANKIQKELGGIEKAEIHDIAKTNKTKIESYDNLIFGIPTWYYGDPQSDWDNFFPILKKINFSEKIIAIFGCGDQEDYAEYFCDSMNIINNIVKNNGGTVVGKWPAKGYFFEESQSLTEDKEYFIGLAIDEDRQPELTNERIKKWTIQISKEINFLRNNEFK